MLNMKMRILGTAPGSSVRHPRWSHAVDRILQVMTPWRCIVRTVWTPTFLQAVDLFKSMVRLHIRFLVLLTVISACLGCFISAPLYCKRNLLITFCRSKLVIGAFFGTTFPHLLFQTYRDIPPMIIAHDPSPQSPPIPQSDLQSKSKILGEEPASGTSSACKIYGPRIYGFRVSERARSGSRMYVLLSRDSLSFSHH